VESTYQAILFEKKGHRATLTINRPDKHNALNNTVINELVQAFEECKADPEIRVVVLTGAGDKAFCAGGDLAEQQKIVNEYQRFVERENFVKLWKIVPTLGKPVIARVQGLALAGGMGLAVNCDFVIASENARFGTPEINVGLFPMMVSTILIRNMGRKKAVDLMFTGRQIDAVEAERLGVVTRVVPAEQLDAEVDALVEELVGKSPVILKLGKDALYNSSELSFDQALDYLSTMLSICTLTEDSREGLTAFIEKRKPNWLER
jgi:enoyl-CoA hydratase/carnithine racemase